VKVTLYGSRVTVHPRVTPLCLLQTASELRLANAVKCPPSGTHKPPSLKHSPLSRKGGKQNTQEKKNNNNNAVCNLHIGSLPHFGLLWVKVYRAEQRRKGETKNDT
jgi:hypothetical protein